MNIWMELLVALLVIRMVVVGIDIGATWTRVVLADHNGKFISEAKRITTLQEGENKFDMLRRLELTIRELLSQIDARSVESIGVGTIGPLDLKRGAILRTPNLPIENVPIRHYLREKFQVPVYVVNDCTAAVIGEKFFGIGKGYENVVYITISSGIGGGAIVDGNVLFGKDGNAVEIGHIVVDYSGRLRCGCGGYGHWEAYTSGRNIGKFVNFLITEIYGIDAYKSSTLGKQSENPMNLKYYHITAAAKSNDSLALKILDIITSINAAGLASVINAYDPDVVSIGGSVIIDNPPELLIEPVKERVTKFITNREPKILITPLRENAVLIGALAIAINPEVIPKKFREF